MAIHNRLPSALLVAVIVLGVAACSGSSATPGAGGPSEAGASAMETAAATPQDAGDPYANVDVCGLATSAEVTTVMGVEAHDPQESVIGPGASIDGAYGCFWSLGDSIDLFDLWIYPAAAIDVSAVMRQFWAQGYEIEPLSGYGDEAVAVVWRGDPSIRDVGQVAGVGVRQGGKAVLMTTLLLGETYTDPKPAAQLAVQVLGRF
jgi:hypothetical protein